VVSSCKARSGAEERWCGRLDQLDHVPESVEGMEVVCGVCICIWFDGGLGGWRHVERGSKHVCLEEMVQKDAVRVVGLMIAAPGRGCLFLFHRSISIPQLHTRSK
jgi:hypothetical protein